MSRVRAAVRAALALLATTVLIGSAPSVALADHTQESVFQDDQYLIDSPTITVAQTLALLRMMGVQRIRVNVLWSTIAPNPTSSTAPANFDAGNPAAYPAAGFAPYDRVVQLTQQNGIGVEFNITAPGPLWAMRKHSPTTRAANHWEPNAHQYLLFVYALGLRYSGAYNPPDPYQTVTPAQQAAYLNEADYIAWRNPRVRSVAQFLLFDAAPDSRYTPQDFSYWDTFQTGLLYLGGTPKPAYFAYKLPIWIPSAKFRPGARLFVWGDLRAAPHATPQQAQIQWRPAHGRYRTIATVTTSNRRGYLTTRVRPPGTGAIRIAWTSAAGVGLVSRAVNVIQT